MSENKTLYRVREQGGEWKFNPMTSAEFFRALFAKERAERPE
jgi:hypothetical protein